MGVAGSCPAGIQPIGGDIIVYQTATAGGISRYTIPFFGVWVPDIQLANYDVSASRLCYFIDMDIDTGIDIDIDMIYVGFYVDVNTR